MQNGSFWLVEGLFQVAYRALLLGDQAALLVYRVFKLGNNFLLLRH